MTWHVEDGSTISIWQDPWLPIPNAAKLHAPPHTPNVLQTSDLQTLFYPPQKDWMLNFSKWFLRIVTSKQSYKYQNLFGKFHITLVGNSLSQVNTQSRVVIRWLFNSIPRSRQFSLISGMIDGVFLSILRSSACCGELVKISCQLAPISATDTSISQINAIYVMSKLRQPSMP